MQLPAVGYLEAAPKRAEFVAGRDPADAARDFEALLIGELMKASREATKALFPESEESPGSETYFEMAEDAVAKLLAQQDLLGVTKWMQNQAGSETPAKPVRI